MATAAQLRFGRDKKAENDRVSRQAERTQQNLQKKNRRMGIGRIAGTFLGAALTGGSSLGVQAAIAGLGSLAGQKLAQGSTRKLDPLEEGKFNRDITRDLQDEYTEGISDLNRAALQRAGSDAFSVFAVGGLKNVAGMKKVAAAGEKFAAGGAEGGYRDIVRGGIDKASGIVGNIAKGGGEGGVRGILRNTFNNNPLKQAIDNTGTNFSGTAEQNRALAQNLGLDPNASIVDQMQAKGLDSSFESRASMFQQNLGSAGVDISNKATVAINSATGNPNITQIKPPTEGVGKYFQQGDILRMLGGDPNEVPYFDPSTQYLKPDFQANRDRYFRKPIQSEIDSEFTPDDYGAPSFPGTFNSSIRKNPVIKNREDYMYGLSKPSYLDVLNNNINISNTRKYPSISNRSDYRRGY